MRGRTPMRAGFTLIEMLAVLLLTSILLGFVLNAYVDLSNQSARASEVTRDIRRATSLLDRIAHDLERTMLVRKPDEVDPLSHPWVFLADSRITGSGADRIKFVARQARDRRDHSPSDLEMVSFTLRESAVDDDYDLVRWSAPNLPDGLDREFPAVDDPNALLLADGVTHFALRFLGENGEWVEEWDSSQLVESGALPLAVEIEVALAPFRTDESDFDEPDFDATAPIYRRQVLLPVRPLDLTVLLDKEAYAELGGDGGASTGAGEDGGLKVKDCLDFAKLGQSGGGGAGQAPGVGGGQLGDIGRLLEAAWAPYRSLYANHPAVLPHCR